MEEEQDSNEFDHNGCAEENVDDEGYSWKDTIADTADIVNVLADSGIFDGGDGGDDSGIFDGGDCGDDSGIFDGGDDGEEHASNESYCDTQG